MSSQTSNGPRRGSVGGGRFGFTPPSRGALTRKCPKCSAAIGHSCGRLNPAGIWRTIKKPHRERIERG